MSGIGSCLERNICAPVLGFGEEARVRVGSKYHYTCLVHQAIHRIGGHIVKQLVNYFCCVFHFCSSELCKEFVVKSSGIVEEGSNDALKAPDRCVQ